MNGAVVEDRVGDDIQRDARPRHVQWLLPLTILAVVVLAYLPSLGGGWVWDDHDRIAGNESIDDAWALLTTDVWGATGAANTDLFRPMTVMSYAVVHWLLPGPLPQRIANLLLHLAAVFLVFVAARGLGASWELSWFGAALFGLHAGSSETVAWITGRDDLLPAVLFLAAWAALNAGRPMLSGWLLALTPFCKETYLLVPLAAGIWMLGSGRFHLRLCLPPVIGVAAYLAIRYALDLPLPVGAAGVEPVAALGGLTLRGVTLTLVPSTADIVAVYRPAPVLGWVAALLGLALLCMCWRRPILSSVIAACALLAPSASAAANIGAFGDRYFYTILAVLGGSLAAAYGARRWHRLAWSIPVLLAVLTLVRAGDWTSDAEVFGASLRRNPHNPHAAFHVAYDLHTREGDCAAAIPLYELAVDLEARAANNLQACLLATGSYAAAAELGPRAAALAPLNPNPAANTARAYFAMGQLEEAQDWARQAIDKDPSRARNWVLLGNILGRRGRIDAAADAFREALALSPGDPDALLGLEQARAAGGE